MPTVGFKMEPHFLSSDAIIDRLSPIEQQDSFGFTFAADNGFRYAIGPQKITVNFVHRMKARPMSGGPPVMELITTPQPYTKLLKETSDLLVEAVTLISQGRPRQIERVGVITQTAVAEDEIPPGFNRLIDYLGRPWKNRVPYLNLAVCGELGETANSSDRCIHSVTKPEDETKLFTLQLDWQRTFAPGRLGTTASLSDIVNEAEKHALQYFEDVAEGNRFDEQLISTGEI
jgi:hypothetical protein